ncbi:hypothetical protein [Lederbergia galactosidilytica]|uniref:DUF4190 domain-containing protein n=1 Tax=Lederbergia galactosidilytica TaxID=217031 RepID=A0A0Q9Y2B9_9BACI|nr:hypothetical protein [Lederbergia galactosidilytica]KRG11138.1 hypothetical protein ACA29_19255 [Lederbergia galactosidilytica]KRG14338.1 hypothetical protein ACA30_12295 [Virgibacillus soli]MBP1914439.1 hypothetical protein [Lederbergia galactosidilytica]OAK75771.1 hypothetical protein ABB05_01060 [Lederbergia galactosidilytica]
MDNTEKIIIQKEESNGLATAAMVLGIIGIILGVIPFVGWFMLPLWLLAIIFGFIGMRNPIKKGFAITGIILGTLTFVYKIGFWVILLITSAASTY